MEAQACSPACAVYFSSQKIAQGNFFAIFRKEAVSFCYLLFRTENDKNGADCADEEGFFFYAY